MSDSTTAKEAARAARRQSYLLKKELTTSPLGSTLRELMKRRKIKGVELAKAVEISPAAISKILNGIALPNPQTCLALSKALGTDEEENQMLKSAWAGRLPTQLRGSMPQNKKILQLKAEKFVEQRTQALGFKESVARELTKAGIKYEQDYSDTHYSTDFLIDIGDRRTILECRYNAQIDLEEAQAVARLLEEELTCDDAIIVVPYLPAPEYGWHPHQPIRVATIREVIKYLTQ
jgi:transcriptional regulator with XRE-family HTH domain